jgi:hypothetical protein
MRSKLPLIISFLALVVALGVGAGYLFSHHAKVSPSEPNVPGPIPTTANAQLAPSESADDHPTVSPPWNGPEKDAALRRIERLAPTEAEYLCFTLGLIPRDEVFDKVNAKGRLVRYVNSMPDASGLRDLDKAFRQMAMR